MFAAALRIDQHKLSRAEASLATDYRRRKMYDSFLTSTLGVTTFLTT